MCSSCEFFVNWYLERGGQVGQFVSNITVVSASQNTNLFRLLVSSVFETSPSGQVRSLSAGYTWPFLAPQEPPVQYLGTVTPHLVMKAWETRVWERTISWVNEKEASPRALRTALTEGAACRSTWVGHLKCAIEELNEKLQREASLGSYRKGPGLSVCED